MELTLNPIRKQLLTPIIPIPLLHKGTHLAKLVITVTQSSHLGETVVDLPSLGSLHITLRYENKYTRRKFPGEYLIPSWSLNSEVRDRSR